MVKFHNKRKGAALVMVLLIMVVLSILGTVIMKVAVAENAFSKRNEDKLQAHYIARSGAQAVAEYMIKDNYNDAHELIGNDSDWNQQIGGGKFKVTVSEDPITKIVSVFSIGEYKGIQKEVKVEMVHSVSGVGGIFEYAIAAKNGISVSSNGNATEIIGPVATATGTIVLDKATVSGETVIDPSLKFPAIVTPLEKEPPIDYDKILGNIGENDNILPITSSQSKPLYISTGKIDRKNNTIRVSGNGIVHMYVDGNISMDTNSHFDVDSTAKLYVYVTANPSTIKISGHGAQNNIFLYAPDSDISWNNAQPSNEFFGAIIGKTVILHNQLTIKYNPEMASDVDLDKDGIGIKYTGYKWKD